MQRSRPTIGRGYSSTEIDNGFLTAKVLYSPCSLKLTCSVTINYICIVGKCDSELIRPASLVIRHYESPKLEDTARFKLSIKLNQTLGILSQMGAIIC